MNPTVVRLNNDCFTEDYVSRQIELRKQYRKQVIRELILCAIGAALGVFILVKAFG